MTRILCLSSSSKGLHDGEFCQFLTGCNSQSTYTRQVVSIGFGDPFDQANDAQSFEIYLTRSHLRILEPIENLGLGTFVPAR